MLIVLFSFFILGKGNAQFEIKSESVLISIGYFYSAVEYLAPHNFSIEVGAGSRFFNPSGVRAANLLLMGKYYFRTFRGHDELYIGAYGKIQNKFFKDSNLADGVDDSERKSGPSLGVLFGRKWRSFNNDKVTFDLQMGLGKFFGKTVIAIRPGIQPFTVFFAPDPNIDVVFNFTIGYRIGKR